MSEIIRKAVKGNVGPRLVSPSVRAAEKLPATIKTQSVKNQLLRGGAKPIELEYADFDQWLAGQPDRVSSDNVHQYLTERGPLGRVQRLDAQGASPEYLDDDYVGGGGTLDEDEWKQAVRDAENVYAGLSDDQKKFTRDPLQANHVFEAQQGRMPSDPASVMSAGRAWPYTRYENYTEKDAHGWAGDDYREVYWFDPKTGNRNRADRGTVFDPLAMPGPIDAHDADAWVRYHVNRDSRGDTVLDVQNVQSDIGQRVAKKEGRKEMSGPESELYWGYRGAVDRADNAADIADRRIALWVHDNARWIQPLVDKSNQSGSTLSNAFVPRSLDHVARSLAASGGPGRKAWWTALIDEAPEEARLDLLRLDADRKRAGKQFHIAERARDRYQKQLWERGLALHRDTWLDGVTPSVLFRNDNWIQLPARHLVLESAARGGAPIRMPLGVNVKMLENMPRAAARQMYQTNMVNALRSILRPIGGAEIRRVPGTEMRQFDWSPRPGDDTETRSIRLGAGGERAGTIVTPTQKAVEHIKKHGLDLFSLLLLTGAGAASQQEQKR